MLRREGARSENRYLAAPNANANGSSSSRRNSSVAAAANAEKTARAAAADAAAEARVVSFQEMRRRLKQNGELFSDPDFPADGRSLFPERSSINNAKYIWKRPREICRDPAFTADGVSRFDVKQGELGDCWLLAAISSLSMHPKLFDEVVPSGQEFNEASDYCGMFRFRFWRFGEWKEVVVDDKLPTKNNRLCFMHSQDKNEFWSALLEKAYAKLFGCYSALIGGSQSEAMEDFTGGLCETFDLDNAPDNLYEIMRQSSSAQSLIGCSIESDQIEGNLANGLITGHAYSVTDVRICKMIDKSEITLLRVRNPWGNEFEWKGDWSDDSKLWDKVSGAEKLRLGMGVGDDGEFWMDFKDFVQEFNRLEICHLTPEAMSAGLDPEVAKKRRWEMCLETGSWRSGISAGGCRNFIDTFHRNPQFCIEIVDPDDTDDEDLGTVIVGLMQVDMRKITRGTDFHTIGYAIYNLTDDTNEILDQKYFKTHRQAAKSQFVNQREVTGRHKLPPGKYVIVPSTYDPQLEAKFILRIFSEKPNISDKLDVGNCMHNTLELSDDANELRQMKNELPLKKAFEVFAGESGKIHSKQLQKILDRSFSKELTHFKGFTLETCRSLVALVDANMSGFLEWDEFKQLFQEVRLLKTVFKKNDLENTGAFNATELRDALSAVGYKLCNCVFEAVALRYMDPEDNSVSFEDFVLLAVRIRAAFENFSAMDKDEGKGLALVSEKHYLMQTLYI